MTIDIATRLSTHHIKHFDSAVDGATRIFDPKVLTPDQHASKGLHARAIAENRYAIGLSSTAQTIKSAQDVSCDGAADAPGNILGLILAGNAAAIATLGDHALDKDKKRIADTPLVTLIKTSPAGRRRIESDLTSAGTSIPSRVDRAQKQVFFESADGDCVLLTPIPSAKMTAELTFRLADFSKPSAERAPTILLPHGGAQPQNVGYAVAKRSRTSIRGRLPMIRIRAPDPAPSETGSLLRRILGSRSMVKALRFDDEDLSLFARRITVDVATAATRRAEHDHAAEIADAVLEPTIALRERVAGFEIPLTMIQSEDGTLSRNPDLSDFPGDEARFLDGRLGSPDVDSIARKLAMKASRRMKRLMERPDDGEGAKTFDVPDESHAVLKTAFKEALSR